VDSKTVKEYYQILSDTLLGTLLEPFKKRQNRQVIGKAPKFYLFDVGVAGELVKRRLLDEKGEAFGRAFEHLVFMELPPTAPTAGRTSPSISGGQNPDLRWILSLGTEKRRSK